MIKHCFLLFMIVCLVFSAMSVSAFTITYDGITEEYSGRNVTLFVNGEKIEFDMPAIILNSRTLVPARAVFEALDADVSWIEREQKVIVTDGDTVISMTVNSQEALVNNDKKQLDCPAKIVNDRLLIPVRFVAEAIGCEVLWDDLSACVYINKAVDGDSAGDTAVAGKKTVTVKVDLDKTPQAVHDFALEGENPRIVVDLTCVESVNITPDDGFENTYVKAVRTGNYSDTVFRVVIDLASSREYSVVREGKSISITVKGDEPDAVLPQQPEIPQETPKGALVVIDAGHGGEDVGAIGRENGKDVLYEKDVNLAVAQHLDQYLRGLGVNTYMIRDSDETVSLYDRPVIANNLDATLYVSVHSNSFEASSANGTTVLYYASDGEGGLGGQFAQLIQNELVSALGTYDRGLMDGSEMYVIRKSNMPSVIAEMAFISNPGDRAILADDNCRKKAAQAIGRAVVKMLELMNK